MPGESEGSNPSLTTKNNMRKLKRSHKNLFILEAGYIYCKRHNLNYETFIDDVFMTEEFHSDEESEFNNKH